MGEFDSKEWFRAEQIIAWKIRAILKVFEPEMDKEERQEYANAIVDGSVSEFADYWDHEIAVSCLDIVCSKIKSNEFNETLFRDVFAAVCNNHMLIDRKEKFMDRLAEIAEDKFFWKGASK